MTLVRWDPFRDLVAIQDRLNRLMSDAQPRRMQEESYGAWAPPVDIFEREDNLVILAELPGLDKDQIDIRVENGVLFLQGERQRESALDEEHAYRLERAYGPFTRSFTLPTTVDSTRITARYRDGVLELVLPKAEEAKPKKVQIQTH